MKEKLFLNKLLRFPFIITGLILIGLVGCGSQEDNNAPMQTTDVIISTSHGDITVALYPEKAPESVENFLNYADNGFYDGTIFHRVIPGFMIQGGGFTEAFEQKTTQAPIKNEANNGLSNSTGTLAMARTSDPHSATAQFFINVSDNKFLDHTGENQTGWGYAVFGEVTDGMEVVMKISEQPTTAKGGHQDVPSDTIVIHSVKRVE